MNILFIASYYPPYAPMSGTRIGKLTGYFHQRGHGVRVLGAANQTLPPLLQPGVPAEHITYVDVKYEPSALSKLARRLRGGGAPASGGDVVPSAGGAPSEASPPGLLERMKGVYHQLSQIPDSYTSWRAPAVTAGLKLIGETRPDLLYVSLPLHSGLLVAAELARRSGVPLVAEYRDLWVDHPYYDAPGWRRLIDSRLEERAARQVAAYVTVTAGWRALLESKRHRPTELVLNGFDPADFQVPKAERFAPADVLTLFYAGELYGEKRDPSPLFEALRRMGDEARSFHVRFHTSTGEQVRQKALSFGLEGIVESRGPVPQSDILALEQASDILLLLRWDHPSEEAVLAGKLFEYIGAGRPILSVGLETGEAADLIEENGFGLVSKDPDRIAAQLRQWLEMRRNGGVPSLDAERASLFSRDRQFEKLEGFLKTVVASG